MYKLLVLVKNAWYITVCKQKYKVIKINKRLLEVSLWIKKNVFIAWQVQIMWQATKVFSSVLKYTCAEWLPMSRDIQLNILSKMFTQKSNYLFTPCYYLPDDYIPETYIRKLWEFLFDTGHWHNG